MKFKLGDLVRLSYPAYPGIWKVIQTHPAIRYRVSNGTQNLIIFNEKDMKLVYEL